MKVKQKVGLIVLVTVLVLAGLFVLRSYYGNKLGIFADLLTDEKIILAKTVAAGDFDDNQITNLTKVGDAYQIQGSESNQVCGNYPESANLDGMPDNTNFNLSLLAVASPDYQVTTFHDNYYIGNDQKSQVGGGDFRLKPNGDDTNTDNPGLSITRGSGWVQVELDKPTSETETARNAIEGSITFPAGVTLNANSLIYTIGGDGLEAPANDSHDLTSSNDEVTVNREERKVDFYLATKTHKDIFVINYCFSPQSTFEGSISGQVDLGVSKPLSSLRVATDGYIAPRDQVLISADISRNGSDWISGEERAGLRYNFQGNSPRDTYCFRYIKYNIKLRTTASNPASSVKFTGFNVYGGDTCGSEPAFDPSAVIDRDTICSNGVDDDGDGKIDFKADGSGDSGCSSSMDNDEVDAEKICQDGTGHPVELRLTVSEHKDASGADLGKNIYLGARSEPLTSPATIHLVSDNVAVIDRGFQDRVSGLSVYRGEGYFFLYNQSNAPEAEGIKGSFELVGSKVTEVINYAYENPTDGVEELGNHNQDEYAINIGQSTGAFTTTVENGHDGVYIFYEYTPKVAGGCQCQDGVDNDSDGIIDYPADLGCSSALDNDEQTVPQEFLALPACKDGIDNEGDGKVDYPDDQGCESVLDDKENDPVKACRVGDMRNISLTLGNYNTHFSDIDEPFTIGSVVVGDNTVYKSGDIIDLVKNDETIVDNGVSNTPSPAYIKRGPGYVYLLFKNNSDTHKLIASGKLTFSGAKITKAINGSTRFASSSSFEIGGPFERQGDNLVDANRNNDEFTINESGTELSFGSLVGVGSDSVYIYYDYTQTVAGGCQCQDGIDNDNNGLTDFPNDPGCSSAEDNEEKSTLAALISQPAKILPSLISSGPAFWILVIIILLISGGSIYIIIKKDKNKAIK